jgi:hypothetical protein
VFIRSRAPILRSANDLLSRERWTEAGGALLGTGVAGAELRSEVKVDQPPASVEATARLGLREGTSVVVRERRFADDQTIELATTYLSGSLACSVRLKPGDDVDVVGCTRVWSSRVIAWSASPSTSPVGCPGRRRPEPRPPAPGRRSS